MKACYYFNLHFLGTTRFECFFIYCLFLVCSYMNCLVISFADFFYFIFFLLICNFLVLWIFYIFCVCIIFFTTFVLVYDIIYLINILIFYLVECIHLFYNFGSSVSLPLDYTCWLLNFFLKLLRIFNFMSIWTLVFECSILFFFQINSQISQHYC